MGMIREADAIEQQARAIHGYIPPAPIYPAQAAPAAMNGVGADYSAQWAAYYRSTGQYMEAEAIEAELRKNTGNYQPLDFVFR